MSRLGLDRQGRRDDCSKRRHYGHRGPRHKTDIVKLIAPLPTFVGKAADENRYSGQQRNAAPRVFGQKCSCK